MIKRLRIKFVCVMMAIVTVMLGGILGVVIHFTGSIMEMQSYNVMTAIATNPVHQGNLGRPSRDIPRSFFTVEISRRGELIGASGGNSALSDEEYILEITNAVMASAEESGELKAYNLRYLKVISPIGFTIVFSDTTSETETLQKLIVSCTLIFFTASLVFLGITVLLSHWTIKPVAKAWDQQRQFVADASHELKTPLSVIMANAELLQSEDSPEEERTGYAKNILSMTYQMRTLVENMLEMARVDNGALKMNFSPVDFSQLVTDAVLSVQLLFEEQSMGLEYSVAQDIHLLASEQHLYQVLDVLLDNALKYSVPESTVRVSLIQNGRHCILSVSGEGKSLSRDELRNIFKRFYRADKARAMNGSYGLGLSIAESIVHAHKGKIWAESKDGINTFFVQLPTYSKTL